jgi:hypothetical protein
MLMYNSLNAILRPALPYLGNNGFGPVVWIHEVHMIARSVFHALVPKALQGRAALRFND